ncbi:MAG: hypothetical protein K8R99_05850 [Actinomycetia bacterium]|nr:hypothetical protein [Actinomycetes bacterium]
MTENVSDVEELLDTLLEREITLTIELAGRTQARALGIAGTTGLLLTLVTVTFPSDLGLERLGREYQVAVWTYMALSLISLVASTIAAWPSVVTTYEADWFRLGLLGNDKPSRNLVEGEFYSLMRDARATRISTFDDLQKAQSSKSKALAVSLVTFLLALVVLAPTVAVAWSDHTPSNSPSEHCTLND